MKKHLLTAALALSLAAAAHAAPCDTTTEKDLSTPLMYSAYKGDTANVRCLLDAGENLNAANHEGATPLMAAAMQGHTDTVRLLIAKGATLDATTKDGDTALSLAEQEGHAEVAKLLKAAGAK